MRQHWKASVSQGVAKSAETISEFNSNPLFGGWMNEWSPGGKVRCVRLRRVYMTYPWPLGDKRVERGVKDDMSVVLKSCCGVFGATLGLG